MGERFGGRPNMDRVAWTFWISRKIRQQVKEWAEEVSPETGRQYTDSAMGRALFEVAAADPEVVRRALEVLRAESATGPWRDVFTE